MLWCSMATLILKFMSVPTPQFKSVSLAFFSSSPPPNQPNTLILNVVSILTHHRGKSRWTNLQSLHPNGFDPNSFSQITLHIKNNPHLALRFFIWTKRKSMCNHNLLSYSTIVHILARGRLKTQARVLIQEAIWISRFEFSAENGEQGESKPLKVFETLVKTYRQCGSAPFVFDLLIKSCLESKKIDPSIQIARMLLSRGISPSVSTLNSLIRQVSLCRGALEGYAIYREVFGLDCESKVQNAKGVIRFRPNVQTLNALMLSLYQDGLVDMVKELWNQKEEIECIPNCYSYSILMAAYCEEEQMDKALNLWEEMRAKKIELDIAAYNTIIDGFCKIGEIEKAEEFYKEMGLSGIESTSTTFEHLITGHCKMDNVDSAVLVFKDMCRNGFRPEASTVDALVQGLCNKSRVSDALGILRGLMESSDFCSSRKSYEILVKGLCQEGKMEEAFKLQAEMVGKGFKPNSEIYDAFILGYREQGNVEMSEALRNEMLKTQ